MKPVWLPSHAAAMEVDLFMHYKPYMLPPTNHQAHRAERNGGDKKDFIRIYDYGVSLIVDLFAIRTTGIHTYLPRTDGEYEV
jgi:hypothetical protein